MVQFFLASKVVFWISPFSDNEIKIALWSIPDEKAPDLNGFNRCFYKAARSVVGNDVISAIKSFFLSGQMLRKWNTTTITLIPKVKCPSHPRDFHLISCCHVLYNCII